MASPSTSSLQQRRVAAIAAGLNGLDRIEVLTAPAGGLYGAQRLLRLHFLTQLTGTLTTANIAIEGGVRITGIRAESVTAPASQLFLDVIVDQAGDFSPYLLRLVAQPGASIPPNGFDPVLAQMTFSFKVTCPSDFDCATTLDCPPPARSEPEIDYLAKDYASFRRLMLDRLSVLMPRWQERHAADMLVTAVEVLAHVADLRHSYHQDAVATEMYLGTARRRISMRRHARLLDYPMHEGCNARTWIVITINVAVVTLPRATPVLAGRGTGLAAVTNADLLHEPVVFETMHAATLLKPHNEITFYTWTDSVLCLEEGATSATLLDNGLVLSAGDVLLFEELIDPRLQRQSKHCVVRLSHVQPRVDPVGNVNVVEVSWLEADALPFALRLRGDAMEDGSPESILVARGNAVLADHGRRVVDEPLEPAVFTGEGSYRPVLQQTDVTFAQPYDHDDAVALPASGLLTQDPRHAMPSGMALRSATDHWNVRRDLLATDRFDRDVVVEREHDGRAHLRLGGLRPAVGTTFAADYRIGHGSAGNVGAETLTRLLAPNGTVAAAIVRVRNPYPAQGGTDPESMEQVRQFAPAAFRTQERAVTEADYAEVAQRHPEVQHAQARFRWTGSWFTVFLFIDRRGGRPVTKDRAFIAAMRAHVERFRLAGYDLEVRGPRFVPLEIEALVCVAQGYFASHVHQALRRVFSSGDLPDGRRGFFHPDAFTFGQPVYLSQLCAAAMAVPGVASIEFTVFQRWGKTAQGELINAKLQPAALEIVRLDNDPSLPENGRVLFHLHGGL